LGAERKKQVANGTSPTKTELNDTLDELADLLDEALDPTLTREQVVEKVQEAYELAAGEVDEEEEEEEDEDEDDDSSFG
jgi:hypothetical protein